MITPELLRLMYPNCPPERAMHFVTPLQAACEAAEVNTPGRLAAFLAQWGHETSELRFLEENLNYSAEGLLRFFPKYFNGPAATEYARRPQAIANRVYANRYGNGDEASGDGWRFRGRGLPMLTFRANYARCSEAICESAATLIDNPELLADPDYACMAAAWYWVDRDLNPLADAGDFEAITRKINGGLNGLEDRVALWRRAIEALA